MGRFKFLPIGPCYIFSSEFLSILLWACMSSYSRDRGAHCIYALPVFYLWSSPQCSPIMPSDVLLLHISQGWPCSIAELHRPERLNSSWKAKYTINKLCSANQYFLKCFLFSAVEYNSSINWVSEVKFSTNCAVIDVTDNYFLWNSIMLKDLDESSFIWWTKVHICEADIFILWQHIGTKVRKLPFKYVKEKWDKWF